eukprot:COSAG02_NODE_925_length_15858_cov_4.267276_4_plen_174_part_00
MEKDSTSYGLVSHSEIVSFGLEPGSAGLRPDGAGLRPVEHPSVPRVHQRGGGRWAVRSTHHLSFAAAARLLGGACESASGARRGSGVPIPAEKSGMHVNPRDAMNQNDCIHVSPSPAPPASPDSRPAPRPASGSRAAAPSHRPAPCRCEGTAPVDRVAARSSSRPAGPPGSSR